VMGTEGKLGEIHRVIVDAQTDTVTDLVVKHGFVFGGERMVPLSYVDRVDEDGTVHVTLDEQGFAAMEGFTDAHFHAPDPSYLGPPGFANGQFLLDTAMQGSAGVGGGMAGKPLGYPGGEEISPDAIARPTISSGTPILDRDGEEIGEVHELEFEALGGAPQRLVMRRGHLFHTDTELPISWVENLSDAGVVLNVARAQVESRADPDLAEDQAREAGLSRVIDRAKGDAVQAERAQRQHMVAELDVQRGEADHARTR
jgi:uncharacterized protein YrrD